MTLKPRGIISFFRFGTSTAEVSRPSGSGSHRTMVTGTRESFRIFSCFFSSLYRPTPSRRIRQETRHIGCDDEMSHQISEKYAAGPARLPHFRSDDKAPKTKKTFPVFSHASQKHVMINTSPEGLTVCQRHCCCTVIAVRLVAEAFATTGPVSLAETAGHTVHRNNIESCSRLSLGIIVSRMSTAAAVPKPWFPRSRRTRTSVTIS